MRPIGGILLTVQLTCQKELEDKQSRRIITIEVYQCYQNLIYNHKRQPLSVREGKKEKKEMTLKQNETHA